MIHLVRDPRAIINSRLAKGWDHNNNPRVKCRQMEEDLSLANMLPSDRSGVVLLGVLKTIILSIKVHQDQVRGFCCPTNKEAENALQILRD